MKYFLFAFIVLITFGINAQHVEFFGGMAHNKFFDLADTYPSDFGRYYSGLNDFVGLTITLITN